MGSQYYIVGKTWFSTQIVVTDELDKDVHEWIGALSGNLKKDFVRKLLDNRNHMTEKEDRELADSVLEVCFSANRKIIEELIGDESMYEALMEIMEPKLQAREKDLRIREAVDTLRDFGHKDAEIRAAIIKKYNLSAEEAENYLQNV